MAAAPDPSAAVESSQAPSMGDAILAPLHSAMSKDRAVPDRACGGAVDDKQSSQGANGGPYDSGGGPSLHQAQFKSSVIRAASSLGRRARTLGTALVSLAVPTAAMRTPAMHCGTNDTTVRVMDPPVQCDEVR